MSKCNIIHETIIRDIVDTVMDAKNSDFLQGVFNKKVIKSVSSASANLIIVFPVCVSGSIPIKTSVMVSKAIERKAVSMLQMLFSAMNITDSKDVMDYLSKFHTNIHIDDELSVDEFIGLMDKYVVEHENAGMQLSNREVYEAIKEDMKNLKYHIPDMISEHSINDYKVYPNSRFGDNIILSEAPIVYDQIDRSVNTLKNGTEVINKQVLSGDIKKANELVPTTMIINYVSTASTTPIIAQAVIGVKAKLYPIDSADIINRMVLKNKDNNGLLNFIKASTREISFWKDFVFALDRAKLDALSSSGRGSSSKIWKLLERRALKSKVKRFIGVNNDATAITTLAVSQNEVEYLKKNENIDISSPRVLAPIMEAYNLMCFIIIDEAMETVKFLYDDGDNMFETLDFDHLERETSDGGYKKVVNLMTKMTR